MVKAITDILCMASPTQAPDVPAAGEGPKEPVTWQDVLF